MLTWLLHKEGVDLNGIVLPAYALYQHKLRNNEALPETDELKRFTDKVAKFAQGDYKKANVAVRWSLPRELYPGELARAG